MELIEIIKSSLSIFTTTTVVFLIISYTIFKIKDRSRIKPYLSLSKYNSHVIMPTDRKAVNLSFKKEEKSAEENKFNRIVMVKLPIQNKFTIINGNVILDKAINK
jgi:hypothetical protein